MLLKLRCSLGLINCIYWISTQTSGLLLPFCMEMNAGFNLSRYSFDKLKVCLNLNLNISYFLCCAI